MTLTVLEHKSAFYGPRTWENAAKGDVTIALAVDYSTAGEKLTHKAAGDKYIALPLTEDALENARTLYRLIKWRDFDMFHSVVINVAGNGIYTLHKHYLDQLSVNQLVHSVLSTVHIHYPIGKIVSGGQTGVDMAGAIAGYKLGIDVELLLPKGFIQRGIDKIDRQHTREEIEQQVIDGAKML